MVAFFPFYWLNIIYLVLTEPEKIHLFVVQMMFIYIFLPLKMISLNYTSVTMLLTLKYSLLTPDDNKNTQTPIPSHSFPVCGTNLQIINC